MSILSKLKIYARKKLNIDGDVEHLQKQIHFLSALVNFSGKDRMEPNPTLKDKLMSYFQKERGLEELYFQFIRTTSCFYIIYTITSLILKKLLKVIIM